MLNSFWSLDFQNPADFRGHLALHFSAFTILNLFEINGRIQPLLWGKHSKWVGGYFLFLLPQKAFFCLALLFALPVLKPEASLKASEIKSLSLGLLSFHLSWSLVFQVLSQVAEEEEEPLLVKIWVLLASGLLVCIFSYNHLDSLQGNPADYEGEITTSFCWQSLGLHLAFGPLASRLPPLCLLTSNPRLLGQCGVFWDWWGWYPYDTKETREQGSEINPGTRGRVDPTGLETPQGTHGAVRECGKSLALVAGRQSWGHIIFPDWSWADGLFVSSLVKWVIVSALLVIGWQICTQNWS